MGGPAGAEGADDREIESEGERRAEQAEIEKAEPVAEAKLDDGRAVEEPGGAGIGEAAIGHAPGDQDADGPGTHPLGRLHDVGDRGAQAGEEGETGPQKTLSRRGERK